MGSSREPLLTPWIELQVGLRVEIEVEIREGVLVTGAARTENRCVGCQVVLDRRGAETRRRYPGFEAGSSGKHEVVHS